MGECFTKDESGSQETRKNTGEADTVRRVICSFPFLAS